MRVSVLEKGTLKMEIDAFAIGEGIVKEFGNSAHTLISRKFVGERVLIIPIKKCLNQRRD